MKSNVTGNVLVLGHGERAFLAVIRSLGRIGLNVHVGMGPKDDLALKSIYIRQRHEIPDYFPGEPAWLETMLSIVRATRFDLVIPCTDPSLIPLQIHRAELAPYCRVYTLGLRAFRVAFDKIESCRLSAELGLCVPKQKECSVDEPPNAVLSGLALPVVLKPPSSFSADQLSSKRKVLRARTYEQFAEQLASAHEWGRALVQENFIGTGCGVEVLARHGEVLVAFQHVRIHEPLGGGGSSYRRSVSLHPELLSATKRLMAALDYTGVAMVEFKMNMRTGAWVFIEINGRFWGSLPLAIAAGADFPRYLYEMLVLGRRQFTTNYAVGVYARNLTPDLRWFQANCAADRSDQVLATRPLWKVAFELANLITLREHWDTLTLDDLRPGIEEVVRAARDIARKATSALQKRLLSFGPVRSLLARRIRQRVRRAKRILFVCKGNICRSPFAEHLAQRMLPESVQVTSSGYFPRSGRPCPEHAVIVARDFGAELGKHRSRRLRRADVEAADVILVFDAENRARLLRDYPLAWRKVCHLGLLLPDGSPFIEDPYSGEPAVFREAYGFIARALESISPGVTKRAHSVIKDDAVC